MLLEAETATTDPVPVAIAFLFGLSRPANSQVSDPLNGHAIEQARPVSDWVLVHDPGCGDAGVRNTGVGDE